MWELGKTLQERNVKFAMRAGLAISLLASPAFFDATRPAFVEFQGDWALLSVCPLVYQVPPHHQADDCPGLRGDVTHNRSGSWPCLVNCSRSQCILCRPTCSAFSEFLELCESRSRRSRKSWDLHYHRLGAFIAAVIFSIFPENAPVLAMFGFLVSLPCFYIAVTKPKHLAATRFVLLTYNLTCLYR